jgi:putative transcriptional regulator
MSEHEAAVEIAAVAAIRKRLKLSQQGFARLLGVSVRTIQEWEQGRCQPTGPAKALLRIADQHPEVLFNLR